MLDDESFAPNVVRECEVENARLVPKPRLFMATKACKEEMQNPLILR
jgi:hypothetical protein